jgi:HAAS domain-containing protein
MTPTTRHPLVDDYLDRLERAAAALPRSRRKELVAEIEAHLDEAIAPGASDAEVLTALDRVGEPEEIVGEEAPPPPPAPARDPRGLHEWAAIWLLLLGGFIALVGWLAGLVLLWSSRAWTTRDKVIGTLVVPGGLVTAFVVFGLGADAEQCSMVGEAGRPLVERCTGGNSTAEEVVLLVVLAFLVLGPVATSIYLARRAKRSPLAAT